MNYDEILLEMEQPSVVYEDEYRKVIRILDEIPITYNLVKRIQLVVWKSKKTDIPDLDIRIYDKNESKYHKGITLTLSEVKRLSSVLKEFIDTNE